MDAMRRTRWWVLVTAIMLSTFFGPWFWLTVPASLFWWTPLMVDSMRAFRGGLRQDG
jgi:hypothetical protein